MGLLTQRAYAWFAGASRKVTALNRPLNFSIEYKGASGTRLGETHSSTFDQLSPSNHDKFGHEDLFGWRNLKTVKSLETMNLTKSFALNLMYSNEWLFSPSDALYNSQGSSIAVSKKGIAGTHVGQELDSYLTYTHGAHLLGAGFGHFFKGEFIANTTPNINPRYFYVFQQYSFK
jgi:Alginate export